MNITQYEGLENKLHIINSVTEPSSDLNKEFIETSLLAKYFVMIESMKFIIIEKLNLNANTFYPLSYIKVELKRIYSEIFPLGHTLNPKAADIKLFYIAEEKSQYIQSQRLRGFFIIKIIKVLI